MKILKQSLIIFTALFIAGCTSTVGNNVVNDKGYLASDTLDWPALEDAYIDGIYPDRYDLDLIREGMPKKELYRIIERPHFSEMSMAKEWNYIMKFKQENGNIKVCQYKILFDEDELARSFYWKPENCLKKPVVKPKKEKFDIKADALFPYNRGGLEDIKPSGKQRLNKLSRVIKKYGNSVRVHLVGHTDYLGSEDYNMQLSEQRAESVKKYLVSRGLNPKIITYGWRGETQPIKNCSARLPENQLKKCLAPNRRVSVEITRYNKNK